MLSRAPAQVFHNFCPLMTNWSPSRFAVVRIAPTSEPASGSEIEIDSRRLPMISAGSQCAFCSSLPLARMLRPENTQPPNAIWKSALV